MKNLIIKSIGAYLNTLAYVAPAKTAQKGFLLFCRPMRGAITEKQHEFFNTAEKFFVDVEGTKVQGYRWGKGEKKIIFFHGWQSHTYRWKLYIESLDLNTFSVYSFDAPGHGLSEGNFLSVPLYSQLMESVIQDMGDIYAVVGHSLGSFSLLYTFYRLPFLPVKKLILMAPPGEASDFISVFKTTLGLSNKALSLVTDYFMAKYSFGPEYFSTIKFVEKIDLPGLIIHDEGDTEAPYRYAVPLHNAWKGSRLITTKGFGHNLRSTTVVKEVIDFVSEPVRQLV